MKPDSYRCPGCHCDEQPYYSGLDPAGYYCPKCGCRENDSGTSFVDRWWGLLAFLFFIGAAAAFFALSRLDGAECTVAWDYQQDATSFRVYCGLDLKAVVNAPVTQATIQLPDAPCVIAVVAVNASGQSAPSTLKLSFVTYQDSLDMLAWRNAPGKHIEYLPGKRFHRAKLETPP